MLRELDGGQYHRLEQLAASLADSPEQVVRRCARLAALGVPVERHPRHGIRLREPVRPLDAARIGAELRAAGVAAA